MRQKRLALRSCIACGKKQPKRQLLRIVRTLQGTVEVDPTGKKAGRGAYLCLSESCWRQGLKGSRLDYALRGPVSPKEKEELLAYYQTNLRPTLSREEQ